MKFNLISLLNENIKFPFKFLQQTNVSIHFHFDLAESNPGNSISV